MSIVLAPLNAIELQINPGSGEKRASLELAHLTAQGYAIKRVLTDADTENWTEDEVAANLIGVFVLSPDAAPSDTAILSYAVGQQDFDELDEMRENGWTIQFDLVTEITEAVLFVTYIFTRSLEG